MSVAGDKSNSRAPAERHVECYLIDYFNFYNRERFHQSLDYRTPASKRIASKSFHRPHYPFG